MKKIFTSLFFLASLISTTSAQVSISSSSPVTQNFDALGTSATATLPTGWKTDKSTSTRVVGSYASAGTATENLGGASMSTTASNGIYNYGPSIGDRAIGGLSSASASKSVNVYVDLLNAGPEDIGSLNISFNVEKYRNGSNTAGFAIQMYYSTNGTSWTSAGTTFGASFTADADNTGSATVPIATQAKSGVLTQTIIAGDHLYLAWNYAVATGSTTSNAQALGIDDVSISVNSVLPVNLSKFDVTKINNTNKIDWVTMNEDNAAYFEVERSNDGRNFTAIGKTAVKGAKYTTTKYVYTDAEPNKGMNYYRLKMVDRDNKFEYSKIVSMLNMREQLTAIILSTSANQMRINVYSEEKSDATISVVDVAGRVLYSQQATLSAADNILDINTDIASGMYILNIQTTNGQQVSKMVTLR